MNSIERFFIYSGSCDPDIISECPVEDKEKYISLGILVFLTALFASVAGHYAVSIATGNSAFALCFCIFWGIFIFSIDRLLVGSIRLKNASIFKKVMAVLARLLLALVISFAVSHLICLKIFEPELEALYRICKVKNLSNEPLIGKSNSEPKNNSLTQLITLEQEKAARSAEKIQERENLNKSLSALKENIKNASTTLTELTIKLKNSLSLTACECGKDYPFGNKLILGKRYSYATYYDEEKCKIFEKQNEVTGDPQMGEICKKYIDNTIEIQDDINKIKKDIKSWENEENKTQKAIDKTFADAEQDASYYNEIISSLKKNILAENEVKSDLIKDRKGSVSNGLMDRVVRLWSLFDKKKYGNHGFMVFISALLLILVIEMSPVLCKAVVKPGEYEDLLELQKSKTQAIKKHYSEVINSPTGGLSDKYFEERFAKIENHKKNIDDLIFKAKFDIEKERIDDTISIWKKDKTSVEKFLRYVDSIGSFDGFWGSYKGMGNYYTTKEPFSKDTSAQSKREKPELSLGLKLIGGFISTVIIFLLAYAYTVKLEGHDANALSISLTVTLFAGPLLINHLVKEQKE